MKEINCFLSFSPPKRDREEEVVPASTNLWYFIFSSNPKYIIFLWLVSLFMHFLWVAVICCWWRYLQYICLILNTVELDCTCLVKEAIKSGKTVKLHVRNHDSVTQCNPQLIVIRFLGNTGLWVFEICVYIR